MQKVILGNCLDVLRRATPNSIDAIVTDPPYGLSFMGKKWDYDVPSVEIWQECLRVLKPGGYLLAFAGTRTQHRMAVRIEDAGFEIRDMIAWVYGSGFPKSLNIGKAVDKLQGNERESVDDPEAGRRNKTVSKFADTYGDIKDKTDFVTKGTSEWEGWGTALKPALEPITMARKPLSEKTVAENVLKYGTGGINIDESRVEYQGDADWNNTFRPSTNIDKNCWIKDKNTVARVDIINRNGRFPANLIHDNSEEVRECFPESKSKGHFPSNNKNGNSIFNTNNLEQEEQWLEDSGNASRFFKSIIYQAKASKSERNKGCEELEEKEATRRMNASEFRYEEGREPTPRAEQSVNKNNHPTVKPIALMEYLVKMVSREGALVLDPFAGSGSTLLACKNLGRGYVGIEMDEEYVKIINARLGNTL